MKKLKVAAAIVVAVMVAVSIFLMAPIGGSWRRSYISYDAGEAGIDATTRRILIDLSDTTNFPHTKTDHLVIKSLSWQASTSTADSWVVRGGVIRENDATNGTVSWIFSDHIGHAVSARPRTSGLSFPFGMNLKNGGTILTFFRAGDETAGSTVWDNDQVKTTSLGDTVLPAPNDLVLELIELESGSSLFFNILIEYEGG